MPTRVARARPRGGRLSAESPRQVRGRALQSVPLVSLGARGQVKVTRRTVTSTHSGASVWEAPEHGIEYTPDTALTRGGRTMRQSREQNLTSNAGSQPRPDAVIEANRDCEAGLAVV